MKKGIYLMVWMFCFFFAGCSGIEKGKQDLATTEGSTDLTAASVESVQFQDPWIKVAEHFVDMDGDLIEDIVVVEEKSVAEGYSLRVVGKNDSFERLFKGIGLTAETHILVNGTYGHSLLVVLNETETENDSQKVQFYEAQQGAFIFDFVEGKLVPLYIASNMVSPDGTYRFQLSLVETVLEIKDSISGMGVKFELVLGDDQKKNIHMFDVQERVKLLNKHGFNRIFSYNDSREVCFEKIIYGVMNQDVFAKIRLVYTFVDGRWQTLEEYMMTDNPEVFAVQKIATDTQRCIWNPTVIATFEKVDLETLLLLYEASIDGTYAQSFASRLSVLYSELGAREILRGLGQAEEKHVKGIAKLLISERLIEFGDAGWEELNAGFGMLSVVSAMSEDEAKALQLVMEALDETSDRMK